MKKHLVSVTCDRCGADMGLCIDAVSVEMKIANYNVKAQTHPGPAPGPHFERVLDFCNRECARVWMAANL